MTQQTITFGAVHSPIRVLPVDDHRSVLWGLRKLIEGEAPRMCVVGEATCWQETLKGLTHDPHVILLDLDLGEENGLDLVAQLRERSQAKVIILSGSRDAAVCEQAVMQGAVGVVHKSEPAEVILKAISCVHAGELWLDRRTTARIFASLLANRRSVTRPSYTALLTDKERSVVAAVVKHKGAPAKVIADSMDISAHTLRNHLASIYGKLNMHRRVDLVLYGMDVGLDKQEANGRPA